MVCITCCFQENSLVQSVPLPEYGGAQVHVKSLLSPICTQSAFSSQGFERHGSGAIDIVHGWCKYYSITTHNVINDHSVCGENPYNIIKQFL